MHRCSKHGFENSCVDAIRKKRTVKKPRADGATHDTAQPQAHSSSSSEETSPPQVPEITTPMTPVSFLSTLLQDDIPMDMAELSVSVGTVLKLLY